MKKLKKKIKDIRLTCEFNRLFKQLHRVEYKIIKTKTKTLKYNLCSIVALGIPKTYKEKIALENSITSCENIIMYINNNYITAGKKNLELVSKIIKE